MSVSLNILIGNDVAMEPHTLLPTAERLLLGICEHPCKWTVRARCLKCLEQYSMDLSYDELL